jgi:predicted DNA-binding transcriptional regulator YafY
MERKHLPKTALPRIYKIDEMIASGTYPSTEKIAREYETSVSSISRDIAFMRDYFDAPIEYSALRRGYYYAKKTYRLPGTFTTVENMQALGMAKTLLNLYRGTPLYSAAKQLLDSITAPLKQEHPTLYTNRIIVPPVAAAPVESALWDTLTAALEGNRVVTFDYTGIMDKAPQPRRVRPYQLLFDTGAWFLYSYDEMRRGIRLFSLARISNAALSPAVFRLPPDYDYLKKNKGSYFGVFDGDPRHFRIAFSGPAVATVTERTWAADQQFESTGSGVIMDFTSSQYGKVLVWLLSHGAYAEPLEPEALVNDWLWHIKALSSAARKHGRGAGSRALL